MDKLKKRIYILLTIISSVFVLLYFFSIDGSLIICKELNEISLSLSTCFISGLFVAFSFDYADELKRKRRRKDALVFLLSACVDTFKNSILSIAITKLGKTDNIFEKCKKINCYSYFVNLFTFNKAKNCFEQGTADNKDLAYLLKNFKVDSYFSKSFEYIDEHKPLLINQEIFSSIEFKELDKLKELFNKVHAKTNTRVQKTEYVLKIYSILLVNFKVFKRYLNRPASRIFIDNKDEKDASEMRLETFKKYPAIFY